MTQGSFEEWEEAVRGLKGELGGEEKVEKTIILNGPFDDSFLNLLEDKKEITQSVPHLPEGQRLFLSILSGRRCLILVQPLTLSAGFRPDVVCFSSRVRKTLNRSTDQQINRSTDQQIKTDRKEWDGWENKRLWQQ